MSSNVVLGSATRQNLLSLQDINSKIGTSQNALATGLKVSSAVDNAVVFFQSQSLTNRATDLQNRNNTINQGISSLTTATQAAASVDNILTQLQGILNSAATETAAQRAAAGTQFNTISKQLNNLVNAASYQGLNLVNSSTSTLSLQFSLSSTDTFKIKGGNLQVSVLVTVHAVASKLASVIVLNSVGAAQKFSLVSNKTSRFQAAFNILQNAIFSAQATAQTLGGNVTLLQTRLSFNQQYVTTLSGGSDKLVVADVNKESTNLVTLQTRQQLAIQSLSIATQSEQAVLRLFH
jgi:flagellin